jgi:hypothetical protein
MKSGWRLVLRQQSNESSSRGVLSFYERQLMYQWLDPVVTPKRMDLGVERTKNLENEKCAEMGKDCLRRNMKKINAADKVGSLNHKRVVFGACNVSGLWLRSTCETAKRIWSLPLDSCTPELGISKKMVRVWWMNAHQMKKMHEFLSGNTNESRSLSQEEKDWCDSNEWYLSREYSVRSSEEVWSHVED